MNIAIIGLGLIGGSLGLDLRRNGFASHLIGVDADSQNARKAVELGLVDEVLPLEEACAQAEMVILAIPVNPILQVLPEILEKVGPDTTVVDMGSTKKRILDCVANHPRRSQYVAAHPMAGTEFSGPAAAVHDLFHGKTAIICDAEASGKHALNQVERMFKSLFMRLIYMDGISHDTHAAYVSHISHISSFSLALTVLEKEKSEAHIFNLAAGGFASTVRLAKSSPRMWTDICEQNRDNLTAVLDSYIEQLQTFRELIAEGNGYEVFQLMEKANDIGRILQPESQPGTPGPKNHNLSLQK